MFSINLENESFSELAQAVVEPSIRGFKKRKIFQIPFKKWNPILHNFGWAVKKTAVVGVYELSKGDVKVSAVPGPVLQAICSTDNG